MAYIEGRVSVAMEFSDHHLRGLIPLQFQVSSGLRAHEFHVLLPSWRYEHTEERTRGQFRCAVREGATVVPAIVSRDCLPGPFEALTVICQVDDETNRVERYLTVYRGYESVQQDQDIDISAVRHSLAHSNSKLRDPAVVASLQRRFGSLSIDFRSCSHQKEFYRSLAKMLIAIDQSLHVAITSSHVA
jgi:hypothetical protein